MAGDRSGGGPAVRLPGMPVEAAEQQAQSVARALQCPPRCQHARMVLKVDTQKRALEAGSAPVDVVDGIARMHLNLAVAPQVVELEPPAPFAEGQPDLRRAAQARDIEPLEVAQGYADADAGLGGLRCGGRGQDEGENERDEASRARTER